MLHQDVKPARVFCSYSHRDDEFRCELEAHLASLTRRDLITFWYDRRIVPGDEFREAISKELDEANIILLLISAYFISSDYCYKIELGRALKRHGDGSAVVIPIFVRPCDWEGLPFSELQGLPPGKLSISEYENPDTAWASVAKGVRETLKEITEKRQSQPEARPAVSTEESENYEASTYLRHLRLFRDKDLSGLRASSLEAEVNNQIEPLTDVIETWAKGHSRPLFLLVGEPGSGKTWTFRNLAATLADQVLRGDTTSPQPIYLPFHSLQSSGGIKALYNAVPEARRVLDRLIDGANTVLLLDGIDEITLESSDTGLRILVEILQDIPANTAVAISCRTQLASDLLTGLKLHRYQPLMCRIQQRDIRRKRDPIILFPPGCQPADIDAFLDYRQPKTFPHEIQQSLTADAVNLTELYIEYVSTCIYSAQERDKRVATVPAKDLWTFLRNMAGQMFPSVTTDISDLEIDEALSSSKLDIINGFVASGLLTLNSREFISFSHVSLFEFFFAQLLFEELSSWNALHLSQSNLIYSYNINRFLIPMLLDAPPIELTPRAHRTLEKLREDAIPNGTGSLTQPILATDFTEFVEDTGWRLETGFGQWITFTGPSGKLTASDGIIMPERGHIPLDAATTDRFPAASLSWYDAHQFARWIGGTLPAQIGMSPIDTDYCVGFEWTSRWFKESESLISVRHVILGNEHGVNPDVRSSQIGFRVQLTS